MRFTFWSLLALVLVLATFTITHSYAQDVSLVESLSGSDAELDVALTSDSEAGAEAEAEAEATAELETDISGADDPTLLALIEAASQDPALKPENLEKLTDAEADAKVHELAMAEAKAKGISFVEAGWRHNWCNRFRRLRGWHWFRHWWNHHCGQRSAL